MVIKGKKARLREDWLNDEKTMIITSSEYEVKDKLLSAPHMMRVLYDASIDKYMVCDGYHHLHQDMIQAAKDNYYYPETKSGLFSTGWHRITKNSDNIFLSWVPKHAKEAQDMDKLLETMAIDYYTKMYVYEDGYMFSQEKPKTSSFTTCALYQVLGKCKRVENVEASLPLIMTR